jgi:tRNA(fMet)-specific endonuclease VapC
VKANSVLQIQEFGQLALSEFNYYEVTRGLKAGRGHLGRSQTSGQLIGEIDVLIASVALREGLAVATCNTSHFGRINGLTVIDWSV